MPDTSRSSGPDTASSQGVGIQARSQVLQIMAELSGLAVNDISPSSLLSDVGIGSLTMVGLQQMLEETFCVSLEDKLLDVEYTAEQLMTMVGISGSTTNTRCDSNTESMGPKPPSTPSNKPVLAADIKPFLALVESDKHFDESARRRNFVHYWRDAKLLQDKLTVAHILSAFSSLGLDLSILEEGQQLLVIRTWIRVRVWQEGMRDLSHVYERFCRNMRLSTSRHHLLATSWEPPVDDASSMGSTSHHQLTWSPSSMANIRTSTTKRASSSSPVRVSPTA